MAVVTKCFTDAQGYRETAVRLRNRSPGQWTFVADVSFDAKSDHKLLTKGSTTFVSLAPNHSAAQLAPGGTDNGVPFTCDLGRVETPLTP